MSKPQISELVKDKFRMKGNFAAGVYLFKGAKIDTSTCDLDTLEKAVAKGFDVVEEIKPPAKDTTKK